MSLVQPGSHHPGRQDDTGVALVRWIVLLSALVVVSVLHYKTSPEQAWLHNVYQRLYYAPIVMGAYWYAAASSPPSLRPLPMCRTFAIPGAPTRPRSVSENSLTRS